MNQLLFSVSLTLFLFYSVKGYSQEVKDEDSVGYLVVYTVGVDSVHVVINDDFNTAFKIASGDTLTLPTGPAKVRVIKKYYSDQLVTILIREGKTVDLIARMTSLLSGRATDSSSYARIFWGGNNFFLSDPDTELFVNGEFAGSHYIVLDSKERFEVTGVHSTGAYFSKKIRPDRMATFNFHQRHFQPSRATSRILSFFPGGSQFYKKQNIKAVSFIAAIIGGAALAYSYDTRYQISFDNFIKLNDEYRKADNPTDAYYLGLVAQEAYDKSVRLSNNRDRIIYGTALVYLLNIVDGFIAPSIGFRDKSKTINPYLDFDPYYLQPVVRIKTTF